jgi:hypothetical protein
MFPYYVPCSREGQDGPAVRLNFPKRTDRRANDAMHDLRGNVQSQAQAGVADIAP